jgi:Na+-translocating ferredoxin:NAD+ oxidoreductase subunit G
MNKVAPPTTVSDLSAGKWRGARQVLRGALVLGLGVGLAAAMIMLTDGWTACDRELNRIRYEQQVLARLVPDAEALGSGQTSAAGQTLALGSSEQTMRVVSLKSQSLGRVTVWLDWQAPDGYSGPIDLALAFADGGELLAVDVLSHRETPGLGDRIERERSDWLQQFATAHAASSLYLSHDGGAIDGISGATITARAVTNAVRAAVLKRAASNAR